MRISRKALSLLNNFFKLSFCFFFALSVYDFLNFIEKFCNLQPVIDSVCVDSTVVRLLCHCYYYLSPSKILQFSKCIQLSTFCMVKISTIVILSHKLK